MLGEAVASVPLCATITTCMLRLDHAAGVHNGKLAHRYGTGDPKVVFVERKTHREGWKGEMSVKERFMLKESQVIPFLENRYSVEEVRTTGAPRTSCRHA